MSIIAEKTEKQWQAEGDARTLADAEEIKADKPRAVRAVKAAKKQAVDAAKSLRNMKKIANTKTGHQKKKMGQRGGKKR